jgi:hypothetical protein
LGSLKAQKIEKKKQWWVASHKLERTKLTHKLNNHKAPSSQATPKYQVQLAKFSPKIIQAWEDKVARHGISSKANFVRAEVS